MSNKKWLESEDLKFANQLLVFAEKIVPYATTFGLSPAALTAIQNDADFARFVILGNQQAVEYKKAWIDLKDQVRYGTGGAVTSPFPAPVNITTPPTTVNPGVEVRFRAVVKSIKANANYTLGIGEILGIEAGQAGSTDLDAAQPVLKQGMSTAGHPELKWSKGIFQGIEVWIDRGDGKGWVYLDKDFNPDFTDKISALPAAGTSTIWKYRAIYLYKGEQAGQWSEIITITVHGSV